jgi:FkbM family methyltransferase
LWDVGANVGAYALVAAKASAAKVVAVEPGYATFAVLCDNIGLNELEQSIIPLQLALTRTTGLMSLTYSDVAAGRALHRIEESDVDSSARSQPVLGYALDDLLERFRLPPPNHVKLDVDGAEAAVIAGARATLARPNLESVLVEVHAAEAAQVDAELLGAGLTQIEEYRPTPKPDRPPPAHVYRLYARER